MARRVDCWVRAISPSGGTTLAFFFPLTISNAEGRRLSVDERSRLQLAEAVKRALGDDEGITLMELLPPVGWADVATKHDLLMLEGRMGARFESLEYKVTGTMERELRSQTWRMFSINAATMGAVVGALIAVARL
jgi:hypothetical protein